MEEKARERRVAEGTKAETFAGSCARLIFRLLYISLILRQTVTLTYLLTRTQRIEGKKKERKK